MKSHHYNKRNKGFTLIELLVVIAIIGLLSSIILASVNQANMQGRDAKRISDINEIKNALALYAADNGGAYPVRTTWIYSTNPSYNTMSNPLYAALVPKYIASLPVDPLNTCQPWWHDSDGTGWSGPWAGYYCYVYGFTPGSSPKYDLITLLENTNSPYTSLVKGSIWEGAGVPWTSYNFNPYTYTGPQDAI